MSQARIEPGWGLKQVAIPSPPWYKADSESGPSFFKNVQCVRETEILVEQQPPQGVFVCDHAGLVINRFSDLCRRARLGRNIIDRQVVI